MLLLRIGGEVNRLTDSEATKPVFMPKGLGIHNASGIMSARGSQRLGGTRERLLD